MKDTIDLICKIVCKNEKLTVEQMKSKSRKSEIVQARQLSMKLSNMHTGASLATIGYLIGEKDHATVLHANKTVSNLKETDKRYKKIFDTINKEIKKQIRYKEENENKQSNSNNNNKKITISIKVANMKRIKKAKNI